MKHREELHRAEHNKSKQAILMLHSIAKQTMPHFEKPEEDPGQSVPAFEWKWEQPSELRAPGH